MFARDLPKADVVLMGHILHDWNLAEKRQLIAKAYDALPPGGAFVVYDALIDDAIFEAFESLPPGKRRDAEVVSTAIERAVRGSVNTVWGKKPQVHVLVVEV